MASNIQDTRDSLDDDFVTDPVHDQIRGHRAPEILPEIDVAEIATAVYDFLSALRRLMDRPNHKLAISQSEIEVARLRFLRASNVSATVRRLINSGLVLRQANDQDRRAQDLYLSDEGIEMLNSITDEWAMLIARAAKRMDGRDLAKLRRGVPALRNLSIAAESLIEDIQRSRS